MIANQLCSWPVLADGVHGVVAGHDEVVSGRGRLHLLLDPRQLAVCEVAVGRARQGVPVGGEVLSGDLIALVPHASQRDGVDHHKLDLQSKHKRTPRVNGAGGTDLESCPMCAGSDTMAGKNRSPSFHQLHWGCSKEMRDRKTLHVSLTKVDVADVSAATSPRSRSPVYAGPVSSKLQYRSSMRQRFEWLEYSTYVSRDTRQIRKWTGKDEHLTILPRSA